MSKVIEALRSAVEHRERISLDDIDCANLLAVIDRLQSELDGLKSQGSVAWADVPDATSWLEDLRGSYVQHLEAECGDRCNAEYNPCWARKVLNALDTKPGEEEC